MKEEEENFKSLRKRIAVQRFSLFLSSAWFPKFVTLNSFFLALKAISLNSKETFDDFGDVNDN